MPRFPPSRRHQYPTFSNPASTSTTRTFIFGEPGSPTSMTAVEVGAPRLFFDFDSPSRLIRIISLQNSLGPNPPQLPSGRRSARSVLLPVLLPEAQSSEMD